MRYLIDFSYSGSGFNGYQKQPKLRSVQSEIEKVLSNINNGEVIIYAAGRTDCKVNALHQKAHFDLNVKNMTPYKLKGALNTFLPADIHINDVILVESDFHARYMVKSKTYEYKINTGLYNPIEKDFIYQYCKNLNIRNMKKAIKFFKGTHDFTTFTSSEDKRENKIRTIDKVSIVKKKDIITIRFTSKGFLKYQVRNMVGLLIKIGEDKIPFNIIPELLDKKDRRKASNTAPAEGLTLIDISY
jgi:tRNA pseudouridine38-40 synthase